MAFTPGKQSFPKMDSTHQKTRDVVQSLCFKKCSTSISIQLLHCQEPRETRPQNLLENTSSSKGEPFGYPRRSTKCGFLTSIISRKICFREKKDAKNQKWTTFCDQPLPFALVHRNAQPTQLGTDHRCHRPKKRDAPSARLIQLVGASGKGGMKMPWKSRMIMEITWLWWKCHGNSMEITRK